MKRLSFLSGVIPILLFTPLCLSAQAPASQTPPAVPEKSAPETPVLPAPEERPVYVPIYRTNLSPSAFEDAQAASRLIELREKQLLRMHETRKYILKNNQTAQEMRKKILALQAELAAFVENRDSMRKLNAELKSIDAQIDALKPASETPPVSTSVVIPAASETTAVAKPSAPPATESK